MEIHSKSDKKILDQAKSTSSPPGKETLPSRFTRRKSSSLVAVISMTLGTAGLSALTIPAHAQDDVEIEEIRVTGSRIVRRDYESNSPILTVGSELLERSYSSSIETSLNKLPQFTPDKTPDQGSDIQPTATNTPGSATIALRNLGPNRSLVLIDGRRATPSNALMVVDLNTIPSLAIDRVEIITGGASATYGADAVSGVTNFIMKKDFQGFQLSTQYGITGESDAEEWNLNGILGTDFDDGRGNIFLTMSVNEREDALRRNRSWWTDFATHPDRGGTEFFPAYSAATFPFGLPSQAAVDNIFGTGAVPNGDRFYFNEDGTAFTGFFLSGAGGVDRFNGDLSGIKHSSTSDGLLKQNFVDELLTLPLERYNMFSRASYEINDWIGVFAQGMFNKVSVSTIQQPSPAVNGWAAMIPNDGRALPAELQSLLDSRDDPTQPWQLHYYLDYSNRESNIDVYTYNLLAGFEGSIPGTEDWTWEAYASQGESETTALQIGFASLERYRAVITSPNWGAGFSSQGNPTFGGFGGSVGTCTSGFDPFDLDQHISPDCIEAITADISNKSVMQQRVFEFNAQGSLFDLPAGELKAAIGLSHSSNDYRFINDTLTTQGRSFLDQAIGLYPSGNSKGVIKVDEIYAELLIPILADTVIDRFELELGVRYSDYNTIGGNTTYKVLGDLQINENYRLRGGFNRAQRAPNVAELFLAPQQTFVISGGGDPCSINNPQPYSANPATNPTNAAAVQALCSELMEQAAPGTSTNFYNNASFQGSGPAFAFPTLIGNSTVEPETADTWTIGLVTDSPIDAPVLRDIRLSIDYYDIQVEDAIGAQSLDAAHQQCFSPEYNPSLSASSPFCAGINRVANDGAIGNVRTTYYNNGRFETSGVDIQLDWSMDIGPGRLNVNSLTNYLFELNSADLPGNPMLDYAGTLGPNQNGLNAGSFDWRMLNTFSYSWDNWGVSLQWRHLPSIDSSQKPQFPNTTQQGTGSYDLFALTGGVSLGDNLFGGEASLRFGIENLFDEEPPVLEINSAPPPGVLPQGNFNVTGSGGVPTFLYDLQGRRFYMGLTVEY